MEMQPEFRSRSWFQSGALCSGMIDPFSNAGLYDSIPLKDLEEHTLETAAEGIFWDRELANKILTQIASTGFEVERAFNGSPQDIEGVWQDGKITVVQSRPQIL